MSILLLQARQGILVNCVSLAAKSHSNEGKRHHAARKRDRDEQSSVEDDDDEEDEPRQFVCAHGAEEPCLLREVYKIVILLSRSLSFRLKHPFDVFLQVCFEMRLSVCVYVCACVYVYVYMCVCVACIFSNICENGRGGLFLACV